MEVNSFWRCLWEGPPDLHRPIALGAIGQAPRDRKPMSEVSIPCRAFSPRTAAIRMQDRDYPRQLSQRRSRQHRSAVRMSARSIRGGRRIVPISSAMSSIGPRRLVRELGIWMWCASPETSRKSAFASRTGDCPLRPPHGWIRHTEPFRINDDRVFLGVEPWPRVSRCAAEDDVRESQ